MAIIAVVASVAVDYHHDDDCCGVVAMTVAVMAVAMMLMWLWLSNLMTVAVMNAAVVVAVMDVMNDDKIFCILISLE